MRTYFLIVSILASMSCSSAARTSDPRSRCAEPRGAMEMNEMNESDQTVQRDGFWLVGRQARASNDDPGPIGALWTDHFGHPFKDLLDDRITDDVYSVYCEYEGDHTKPYTVFLGYRVKGDSPPPEGLERRFVPGGRFEVHVAAGPIPDAVIATWKEIWSSSLDRAYVADYEIHPAEVGAPVVIYVGVR